MLLIEGFIMACFPVLLGQSLYLVQLLWPNISQEQFRSKLSLMIKLYITVFVYMHRGSGSEKFHVIALKTDIDK